MFYEQSPAFSDKPAVCWSLLWTTDVSHAAPFLDTGQSRSPCLHEESSTEQGGKPTGLV